MIILKHGIYRNFKTGEYIQLVCSGCRCNFIVKYDEGECHWNPTNGEHRTVECPDCGHIVSYPAFLREEAERENLH